MRKVGIVAEYNPFHRGHALHLREARRLTQADCAVAVMTTVFTQRGELTLLNPGDRVRMALRGGADAVFALPAMWTVQNAEGYALSAVSLLDRMGCDTLSFGAEDPDPGLLRAVAELMNEEPQGMREELRQRLEDGMAYAAARAEAAGICLPGSETILRKSNNILAVCYIRALLRLKSPMKPVPVRRQGSYRDLNADAAYASASAIRGAVRRGETARALQALPESARPVLESAVQHGRMPRTELPDALLRYRLLTMTDEEFRALPEVSEGIEHRLRRSAAETHSREDILAKAGTKRYPTARLSRICACALLGLTREAQQAELPPMAWLLGFRRESEAVLRELQTSGLPILAKAADLSGPVPAWFRMEERAFDLWSVAAGQRAGMIWTQGVAVE